MLPDYGVNKYDIGTGFGHFGIAVEDVSSFFLKWRCLVSCKQQQCCIFVLFTQKHLHSADNALSSNVIKILFITSVIYILKIMLILTTASVFSENAYNFSFFSPYKQNIFIPG